MTHRHFVDALIMVQQFGLGVVFVLLAAENLQSLVSSFSFVYHAKIHGERLRERERSCRSYQPNLCLTALVVCLVLAPFAMLESPKDFW